MREIKFRAWHNENKVMVYFDNQKLCYDEYQRQHLAMLMAGRHGDVLMQYTGLKDENGVEIYEGDIIKWIYQKDYGQWDGEPEDRFKEVKFINGSFNYVLISESVEVVGNIHENPELLEQAK